jgi:hypothetical protein
MDPLSAPYGTANTSFFKREFGNVRTDGVPEGISTLSQI